MLRLLVPSLFSPNTTQKRALESLARFCHASPRLLFTQLTSSPSSVDSFVPPEKPTHSHCDSTLACCFRQQSTSYAVSPLQFGSSFHRRWLCYVRIPHSTSWLLFVGRFYAAAAAGFCYVAIIYIHIHYSSLFVVSLFFFGDFKSFRLAKCYFSAHQTK